MRVLALALVALLNGQAALADGSALVIGTGIGSGETGGFWTRSGTERIDRAAQALRDSGLAVTADAGADGGLAAFGRFLDGLEPDGGPVIVLLSGGFLHADTGAWYLPGALPDTSAAVLTRALSLDAVLAVLARYPGRALLVLAESDAAPSDLPFLQAGPGALDIPQGVSVLRGPQSDALRMVPTDIAQPGQALDAAARRYELELGGYAPAGHVILRRSDVTQPPRAPEPDPPRAEGPSPDQSAADETAWALAREADSASGYRRYLERFPEGQSAAAARQRLAAIEAEPFYAERRAEEALELSREARREIQRDLSLLGYNTRGIDGIFGPGTRRAVTAWQQARGAVASGYLDPRQIAALDGQARERAAALEAEARERQAALERRDRALWAEVERRGDEAALRSYLGEFPDGLYAEPARARLAVFERDRADTAAERDRAAWTRAREADTEAAYRRYLEDRPAGAFVAEARARIEALRGDADQDRATAQARASEQQLGLNPVARRLAEARLDQLGLDPGRVDGSFDADTRRAIRRYQRDRGLTVSGFLDQDTVVRLLADGILGR